MQMHGVESVVGKSVLVTGGGRGIGESIARQLAGAGARVAIVGRDEGTLTSAADRIAAAAPDSPAVHTVVADLAVADEPDRVLSEVTDALGGIDVLVNNAGWSDHTPSADLSADGVDRLLALNVRAPLLLAGHVAPQMAARGGGSIITISSVLGTRGIPRGSLYAASKGAVDGFTRALAAEWGREGLRVNAILPSVIRTDMASAVMDKDTISSYLRNVTLPRVGEPDDIGRVALFLASDASAYITGQSIAVDGGWLATSRPIFYDE